MVLLTLPRLFRKLCTMSPVTDLALNLSDTSLGVTPIQDSKVLLLFIILIKMINYLYLISKPFISQS